MTIYLVNVDFSKGGCLWNRDLVKIARLNHQTEDQRKLCMCIPLLDVERSCNLVCQKNFCFLRSVDEQMFFMGCCEAKYSLWES